MFVPTGYFVIRDAISKLLQEHHSGNTETVLLSADDDSDRTARCEIGVALASGGLRCAGILEDGRIASIPSEFWRTLNCKPVIFENKLIDRIELPMSGGTCSNVVPIVLAKDFQSYFKCQGHFASPSVWLSEWRESPTSMTQGELGEKATEPDQAILEKSTSATRTGRPPKHDWDAFWIEVAHFAAKNDLMPEDRAELQQHMERWAVGAAPNDPMDSTTIRRKLQSLFARRAPK